ncbi:MAG TPA: pantoate--beta-alanine ligase [Puia sp.]|nr:pantoate--beta-alanine ligase [Puia sp.]
MILFKRAGDLTIWLDQRRQEGRSIGFVPTMGALHEGHISLIDISKRATSDTVCSIFVNPTQFNDPKDFRKYPVTIEKDIRLLETAGTDALFLPEVGELYTGGITGLERYDLGSLENILEGKYRPGHFQGVCQVMRRLLDIVLPDHLFMGQKDYQQCMVVRRLLELMGSAAQLHPSPIIREKDGLAMSSRNLRLSVSERAKAPAIYRALTLLKEGWSKSASLPELLVQAREILQQSDFRIDYIEAADPVTLLPVTDGAAIALIAAFMGEIRLIDNMTLE